MKTPENSLFDYFSAIIYVYLASYVFFISFSVFLLITSIHCALWNTPCAWKPSHHDWQRLAPTVGIRCQHCHQFITNTAMNRRKTTTRVSNEGRLILENYEVSLMKELKTMKTTVRSELAWAANQHPESTYTTNKGTTRKISQRYFCPAEYTLSQILNLGTRLKLTLTPTFFFFRFRFRYRFWVSVTVSVLVVYSAGQKYRWHIFLVVPLVI